MANVKDVSAYTEDEKQVLDLMKQVNTISSNVQGSAASKVRQRSELKALMIDQGLPSFYLMINPSDVHNPLVQFLAGSDIDVNDEERACAWGETDISRKLANPHRALRTTRQSNICTTTLIFQVL